MPPSVMPPVGDRIREERQRRGVSQRGLARSVGVSASLISQIELGKIRPSVSTLYAITTALGISVEDVFDAPDPPASFHNSGDPAEFGGSASPAGAASPVGPVGSVGSVGPHSLTADPDARGTSTDRVTRVGPVVRPTRRQTLELDSGVTWQRLGRLPGTSVDFLLVTYAPGGSSSGTDQLMRHTGAEYGYLIEGELILTLGFDDHRLGPGDAVSFESSTPHRYRNEGSRPAVGVWFVSEV